MDHLQRISAPSLMDEEHLKSAKWLKPDILWCYRAASGDHLVQLPNSALTTITETLSCLRFLPDPPIRLLVLPARAVTGSTRRAPQSSADIASSSISVPLAFTHLPATLPSDFVPWNMRE
uniref:Uncharacterized protein n=1 Tax=Noccaea caerulescens TaxID=107243 RepID=A0A1J3DCA8_NOCCA